MTTAFNAPFTTRLHELARSRTRFCLGLDPTPQILTQWGLPNSLQGLEQFIEQILPLCEQVAIVKPQVAFYEQFGPPGLALLQRAVQKIQDMGTMVLLDCKKGDISHTLTAYVQAYVGPESSYRADAMTLTAYLGVEAMAAAFAHVNNCNAAAFVVVHSSNPEGRSIQEAKCQSGLTVAQSVADSINGYNASLAPGESTGPIAAVVGATAAKEDLEQLLPQLGKAWLLTPGLGKQGATYADLAASFGEYASQIIPTSSRGVLEHGPEVNSLRDAISREQDQAALLG